MVDKKRKWRLRTNRNTYLIMSAMRGPDFPDSMNSELKRLTAGVIRWYAGVGPELGCIVASPERAKQQWEFLYEHDRQEVRDIANSNMAQHYICHFSLAMKALQGLGYYGAGEYLDWFVDVVKGSGQGSK